MLWQRKSVVDNWPADIVDALDTCGDLLAQVRSDEGQDWLLRIMTKLEAQLERTR